MLAGESSETEEASQLEIGLDSEEHMTNRKFTAYESLLLDVFRNAVFKFVSAITLYTEKISYNDAWYLCVLAEEELAKMFILPVARELDELKHITNERKHPYYRHALKQKIFVTRGMQNRDFESIEKMKQKMMYVGVKDDGSTDYGFVPPKQLLDEIRHCALLIAHTYADILSQQEFDKNFKKGMKFFMDIAYGCVQDNLPQVNELINKEADDLDLKDESELKELKMQRLISNPYYLIGMCKAVFKEDYKVHLREMSLLSFPELETYLGKVRGTGNPDVSFRGASFL